ncbi:MAG: cation transporter [Desulfobacteraceae bacterium]|nr:cation transporter [Desulfobacteraceae bacterium]
MPPTLGNRSNKPGYWTKPLKKRLVAITISLFIGIVIMAAKFYTYHLTLSSAVLSDALESIINVVASLFAMGSILLSAKPPDEEHPYGHGKIEFFSAGFEGALIVLAAIGIFKSGIDSFIEPRALPNLGIGLLVLMCAAALNLFLAIGLIRTGKQTGSIVLDADGKHILSDVYTSLGVLLGLVLVYWTNWLWLDGLVACLVGLNILFIGFKLVRESYTGLMDTSDPEIVDQITNLILTHKKDFWIDIHKLRTWRSGNHIHVDFHLVLPANFSLERAHMEVRELETILITHFNRNASVLIHTDPCSKPECPICENYDCTLRDGVDTIDDKDDIPSNSTHI